MKFTASQLKVIAERLPDPNTANRSRYCILLPCEILPITNTDWALPSMRRDEQEIVFNRERTYRGYEWVIEFDISDEIIYSLREQLKSSRGAAQIWQDMALDNAAQLKLSEAKFEILRNKWYVRFFITISIWRMLIRYRLTGKIK